MKTAFTLVLMLSCIGQATAQPRLPEGFGLAGKYPGDKGIEKDPQTLFAENFETGTIAEIGKRWGSIKNEGGKVLDFSDAVHPGGGKRALQATATLGENTGGNLYTKLPKEVDTAFARFYVKFAADAEYIHHFVNLGGYKPATAWPQGGAGEKPKGNDRVTVAIEPTGDWGKHPAPGVWNFYNYWHEMKGSKDGKFWGNSLRPAQAQAVPRDRWQCVEIMLKMNSEPDKSDGELALWLDGKLTAHFYKGAMRSPWKGGSFSLAEKDGEAFEGFRWRTHKDLKVNFFWLSHYVTENAAKQNNVKKPNPVNRVWFDDIVVSTTYIGPVKKKE